MKFASAVLLVIFCACAGPVLQACVLLTSPLATTAISGAQLAIKGVELQKDLGKADAQEAFERPFQETGEMSVAALTNLQIEISLVEKNKEGDGGLIEGLAGKTRVKVVVVRLTEKITEVGIWTDHDKALARLIAEKIKEKVREPDDGKQTRACTGVPDQSD